MSAPASALSACVDAVAAFLDPALEALVTDARDALLAAARDAGDPDEEDRLLSAMEEVEALAPAVAQRFRESVLAHMRAPGERVAGGDEDDRGLALVETAKVDDWLRLRKLLARTSDPAREAEAALVRMLSGSCGRALHPDEVPVTVPGACVLFQGAMQGLGAGRDARGAIYDAFETTVVERLYSVVRRLREILGAGVPGSGEADSTAAAPGDPPYPPPGSGGPDAPVGTASLAAAGDGAPARAPHGHAGGGPAPAHPSAAGAGEVSAGRVVGGEVPAAPPLPGRGETLDPARLLAAAGAVSRRVEALAERAADTQAAGLELALAEALAPPGVVLDAAEQRTVAAVARLMQQSLAHPDLDADLRRRMWRLGPPFALLLLHADEQLALETEGARHDPVTGLFDRGAFRSRLDQLVLAGRTPAVCLVDVDGFGAITRRVGSQVGARLLRALGTLLRGHAGDAGRAARLRGDEFAVLLPSAGRGAGRRFAQRYVAAVANARFGIGAETMSLSVSVGVVEAHGAPATTAQVMRAADEARRDAKAAGGACVRVHPGDATSGAEDAGQGRPAAG